MVCTPNPRVARALFFRCPDNAATTFGAPEEWFQEFEYNYLRLYVQPQNWTRVKEGTRTSFKRSFSRKIVQVGAIDYVFTLEVGSDDYRLRMIFEEICAICYNSNYTQFTPVTVVDYVRPDLEQYKAAVAAGSGAEPFTTRTGLIEIEDSSGVNGEGVDLRGVDGFRVVFRQLRSGVV